MSFNLEEYTRKYNVHPETLSLLKATPLEELNDVQAAVKRYSLEGGEILAGKVELEGSEREIIVPSPNVEDGIPVTVYKPNKCDALEALSILVYVHGGGNVVGCRKSHESVCKILARDSPCIVVNVEYRMAPKHKFPANQDDVNCVIEWLAKNKTVVGMYIYTWRVTPTFAAVVSVILCSRTLLLQVLVDTALMIEKHFKPTEQLICLNEDSTEDEDCSPNIVFLLLSDFMPSSLLSLSGLLHVLDDTALMIEKHFMLVEQLISLNENSAENEDCSHHTRFKTINHSS